MFNKTNTNMKNKSIKNILFAAFLLFAVVKGSAQTIDKPTFSFTQICADSSFNTFGVTFNFSPESSFTATNQFIIEIILEKDKDFTDEQIRLLEFGGIQTIQDLNEIYKTSSKCIVEYSKNWRIKRNENGTGTGIIGISIYDTAYYLIAKNKTELEIREFFMANNSMNRQTDNEVKRCLDAYKKLSSECQ